MVYAPICTEDEGKGDRKMNSITGTGIVLAIVSLSASIYGGAGSSVSIILGGWAITMSFIGILSND